MMDWARRIRQRLARSPNIVGRSRTRNSWSPPIRRNKRTRGNLVRQRVFLSRRRLQKSPEQIGKVSWSMYLGVWRKAPFFTICTARDRILRFQDCENRPAESGILSICRKPELFTVLAAKNRHRAGVLSPGLAEREGFEPSIRL